MVQRPSRLVSDAEVLAFRPAVVTALRGEGVTGAALEDGVQETLTRLLEARERLEPSTAAAYAVATARNLARSARRADEIAVRNRHRLHDPAAPPDPSAGLLLEEERRATVRAVAALPPTMREALLVSRAPGTAPATLAPAARSRAKRARARARVEFVLAFRHVTPPTAGCRSVLLALSASDHRRQASLGAGQHLLDCPVCAELAPPLMHRRRGLAALLPVPAVLLGAGRGRPRHLLTTTAAGVTGLVVVAAAIVGVHDHRRAVPATAPTSASSTAPVATPATTRAPVRTVYFAAGSAALDSDGQQAVDAAAQLLRSEGVASVTVTGYTDSSPGPESNASLALQRADAVAALLRRLLGASYPVTPVAAGSADPAAPNDTESGRARNRRVVIAAG